MNFYLVVDGYNILNSWPELSKMMEDSIEDARDRLIHLLNNYAGYKHYKIILVFDGHKVKDNIGERYFNGKVEIIFSPYGISADHVIEKEVGKLLKENKVFVATSDKLQQEIIWSKGAYRVSSRELLGELEKTQKEFNELLERKSSGKRNYLEANLNKDVLAKLEKIRRKKH